MKKQERKVPRKVVEITVEDVATHYLKRKWGFELLQGKQLATSMEQGRKVDTRIELERDVAKLNKSARQATVGEREKMIRLLGEIPSCANRPKDIATLITLVVYAMFADWLLPLTPHLAQCPAVVVQGEGSMPPLLLGILQLLHGETEWRGTYESKYFEDKWFLRRPCVITQQVPVGSSSPSYQVSDYVGGAG